MDTFLRSAMQMREVEGERPAAAVEPRRTREGVRVVVIGHGMVGHRFCERLLEFDEEARFSITVFGEESRPAYDRVHLGDHLGGRALDALLLADVEQRGVVLKMGERVVGIDRARKCVVSATGEETPYDVLVLATGARPQVPALEGSVGSNVLLYRTLEDVERIAERTRRTRKKRGKVIVVGGGLLGLELAEDLRRTGCAVRVLESASHLMARQLDVPAAHLLAQQLESEGIAVETGARIRAIVSHAAGARIELERGSALECEFVVLATGVRPSDELAREAGLVCGPRGGVEVDAFLRSSDPSIFAIGDCASFRGAAYGLVAPGYAMAETLALGLLGKGEAFRGIVPATRLKLAAVEVNAIGEGLADGPAYRGLTFADGSRYRRVVLKEGRLVGAIAVGGWAAFARLAARVSDGMRIGERDVKRFLTTGELFGETLPLSIRDWPADAPVCMCTGVTCGVLRKAHGDGCQTADALRARTGASSVCGSCRPLLEELTGEITPTGAALHRRSLVGVGAVVALLVALLALGSPFTIGASFAQPTLGDAIVRSETLKQITGYGSLAAALLSMLLSLRSRVSWFRFGSYAGFRLLHVGLGTLALAGIVAHTGLRLGANLDRALMISFVSLALFGGMLSVLTGLEDRVDPAWSGRMRTALRFLHLSLVWPLPVLVLFHVLKFYWF